MMDKISFCTTCRNRLWQLKQTLAENISFLRKGERIVLVDYGSTDGTSKWVWENHARSIAEKKLTLFEVTNKVDWNVARAKNLAHRIAPSTYHFNLDADNFITEHDLTQIRKAAAMGVVCHQWSGSWPDGSYGRIGLSRKLFANIGGYDETMLPMGGQDGDILRRIKSLNYKMVRLTAPEKTAVENQISDKVKELRAEKFETANHLWSALNQINLKMSIIKLRTEGPIRRGGGFSYEGYLNGEHLIIDGFDNYHEPNAKPARGPVP